MLDFPRYLWRFFFKESFVLTDVPNDSEDPYPSLSDFHDYEPNLEFDDTELQHATADPGSLSCKYIFLPRRRKL